MKLQCSIFIHTSTRRDTELHWCPYDSGRVYNLRPVYALSVHKENNYDAKKILR